MSFDCFISYASPDLAHAEALHNRLVVAGFSVWFDKARLREGCDWHREIEQGCESSRVILPVLTPKWKLSEWTRYETYGAETVIPVIAEGEWSGVATPPLTRTQTHAIRLADREEADWQSLYATIREALNQEPPQKDERVTHLRYRANPHFVGREASLDEIHEKLFTNPSTVLTQGHVAAVTALGGVGKTTLARHYAEKFWRCYCQMFWVDCRRGIESEFAGIHDILRPDPMFRELKDPEKAVWTRGELNQGQRSLRLLVIDNAEDEESIAPWIPKTGNCHTIITSRFANWTPGIETYPVWVLEPGPARELLLRRAGRTSANGGAEDCDSLARKLDYLPLALEQAAAYVTEQGPGYQFADYLRLFESYERELLDHRTSGSTEYPNSVFLTWRATVERLPVGARAILRVCSFMASAPIPTGMLIKGATILRALAEDIQPRSVPSAGELEARHWKSILASYSMIRQTEGDSFSIHGLVQLVERHQVTNDAQPRMVTRAVALLMSWAPADSLRFENWAAWKIALPHAQALWESQQVDFSLTPGFLVAFGSFLMSQGAYAPAEPVLKRANEVYDNQMFRNRNDAAAASNNLAMLYENQGRYAEAELLHKRAVLYTIRRRGLRPPDTLSSENNLGHLYVSQGRHAEAEPLLQQVLRERERLLGPEHPLTLTSLSNLAGLYDKQGRYAEAEPLLRRALRDRERVLGPDHPDTLISLNNLAALQESQGRNAEAESLYLRALSDFDRVLGPEHPDTLSSVSNLGFLYDNQGRYAEAEPLYQRALRGRERVLGPDNPDTLVSINNLAMLYENQRRWAEAEPLYQRAVRGFRDVLGEDHPDTRMAVSNYETFLQRRRGWRARLDSLRRIFRP